MKLIIEKQGKNIFAYIEKEKIFKKNEKHRLSPVKLDTHLLDNECNLNDYEDGHFVFDLK